MPLPPRGFLCHCAAALEACFESSGSDSVATFLSSPSSPSIVSRASIGVVRATAKSGVVMVEGPAAALPRSSLSAGQSLRRRGFGLGGGKRIEGVAIIWLMKGVFPRDFKIEDVGMIVSM